MLPHAHHRGSGGRIKKRPALPKRAASNRRDHAKIASPGATPWSAKTVDLGRYLAAAIASFQLRNARNGCRTGAAALFPCPAHPENSAPTRPAMMVPIEVTATAGLPAACAKATKLILRDRAQDFVVVAAGRRAPRCRRLPRASSARSRRRQRNALAHRSRPTRRTPRRAWRDRRQARRIRPSRRWHDRARPSPARCAAAARGSGRPAFPCAAASSASAAAAAPPLSTSRPSAASPIVPVTTTRSPGFAPLRWTILPGGTRPNAVTEIISGPGVDTVSPPSSGQPNRSASSPSARANGASQPSSALRSASVSTKPAGTAPLAARSDRFTRSALRAMRVGRIVGRKCTPSTMASVVTTMSSPVRLQDRRVVVEVEARRDRSRAA